MGDRFDRGWRTRWRHPAMRGHRMPPELIAWGLTDPARIGHNLGPPLDEPPPGDVFVRYRWRKAHREAWKNPSMAILKFRVARAEAAGVSYHAYMLALLDTGRHLQAGDVEVSKAPAAVPGTALRGGRKGPKRPKRP